MENDGKPWKMMENHGKPWKMMENHGKPWKMMENHDESVDFRKKDMDCSAILRHQNNHLGRSSQIR